MKLRKCELEQFTVFKKAAFEFSEGINVFIGVNGTGKSHLMKLLYAILSSARVARGTAGGNGDVAHDKLGDRLARKLAGVFRPDEGAIGRLVARTPGKSKSSVHLSGDGGEMLKFGITTESNVHSDRSTMASSERSIFIPSREAFAMYEGFAAAYQDRELSFDETYYDLCIAMSANPLKGKRLAAASALVTPLENDILGGRVQLNGGRFYVYSSDGVIEAHLLSEGLRKVASLVRLIVNGSLMRNGFLFWDEPEANLNPKLVTRIASVLRRLAASGVQVFVATHDYLLTHELSLGAENSDSLPKEQKCPIRFFGMSRAEDGGVTAQPGEILADLRDNAILDEFAALYDRRRQLFSDDREESRK
jgi:ABC-type transport system involved in cytochrome c biogenesis ATPase subunit